MEGHDSQSSNRPDRWQFTDRSDDIDGDISGSSEQEQPTAVTAISTASSSKNNSNNKRNTTGEDDEEEMGKDETRKVRYSKLLVILVLCAAAGVVAYATYDLTQKEAEHDWEAAYESHAIEVTEISRIAAENIFSSVRSLAVTITSFAATNPGTSWPFVTIPHFEARTEEIIRSSGGIRLSFCPLVQNDKKDEWEAYSVAKQGWVQEGLDFQQVSETASPIPDFIYKIEDGLQVPDEDFRYAVTWQTAPAQADPVFVNHNQLTTSFSDTFYGMAKAKEAIWSDLLESSSEGNAEASFNPYLEEVNGPQSFIVQPVWRNLGHNHSVEEDLVGYIMLLQPWDRYFRNLLPPGIDGIDVVIQNSCAQAFTFRLYGPEVLYLGPDDMHNNEYDDHLLFKQFNVHDNVAISEDSVDTLDDHYCLYSVSVYPSKIFVDSHKSNKPLIYTLIVIAIFAITSAVFVLYDKFVEYRQKKVMDTATRATGIVSNLFPARVRDRLMEQQEHQRNARKAPKHDIKESAGVPAATAANNRTVRSAIKKTQSPNGNAASSSTTTKQNGSADWMNTPPIADLFPSATVLFADIAGFTSWSSNREPTSVFMLLEQIYHGFDEIAREMGDVFKVETIGDCYVATTGLPEPSKNHAERMTIFAYRSRIAMNRVKQSLAGVLGNDTLKLSMRFGIHSGPVTAGVLRGEKSRFQLFGDTVNTTARIESLGCGDKIHLSEQTAMMLKNSGKADWVVARDEQVQAKGKGALQTYWLVLDVVGKALGQPLT